MPDNSGLQPPYLDPSQYPDYLDMRRKQMLADMLMGNYQRAGQTPANWDQMKVVPRRSALSNISPLASALMASKGIGGAQQAEQKYFQNQYGGGSPSSAPASVQAAPPATDPNAQNVQPLLQRNPGQSFDQTVQGAAQPQQPSGSPLIPPNMDRGTASMLMGMLGPQKFAEVVSVPTQMGSTAWQDALRAANNNPDMARQLLLGKLQKEGIIDLRGGGEALIPNGHGGYLRLRNPNLPVGVEPNYDPTGMHATSATLIPGVAEAEQAVAQSGALGRASGELHDVERGGRKITQVGIGGIPGAPDTATAPYENRRYFQDAQSGTSGRPAEADRSWWPDMPRSSAAQMPAYGGLNPKQDADLKIEREHYAKLSSQYGLESDTGNQKLEYSAELLRNLPKSFTGPQAPTIAHFWNAVNQVPGIRALIPKGTLQDAAGTQVVVKNLVNQAIQGARAIYGPRMANMEVQLQKNEASPSITMGLQAIYALQRQEDAKSAYQIQRSNDLGRYDAANGNPMRFEGAYPQKFPLQKFAREYAERNAPVYQTPKEVAPEKSLQNLREHPETRQDFIARYGYLPPEMRQ